MLKFTIYTGSMGSFDNYIYYIFVMFNPPCNKHFHTAFGVDNCRMCWEFLVFGMKWKRAKKNLSCSLIKHMSHVDMYIIQPARWER